LIREFAAGFRNPVEKAVFETGCNEPPRGKPWGITPDSRIKLSGKFQVPENKRLKTTGNMDFIRKSMFFVRQPTGLLNKSNIPPS
jgi:hypothetical protein